MPNLLESLAGGLRSAAGVLNPRVQEETFASDERQNQTRQQQQMLLLQHVQSQVAAGSMSPEQGQAIAQRLGAPPQLVGGPSIDVQGKQAAAAKERQYQAAVKALGPNPTQEQLAQVGARFSDAKTLMTSQQASLDRQAALDQRAFDAQQAHDAKVTAETNQHEYRMGVLNDRGADQATLRAETERHNKATEEQAKRHDETLRALKALGGRERAPHYITNAEGTFQVDSSGQARPVMGPDGKPLKGKADAAALKLAASLPQARLRTETMTQNMDRLEAAMKELHDDPGLTNITGTVAGRTPNLTNRATGAQAKLNSVKSQIFQSALQSMREASKTGGAVGNVSDREGDKLEQTLAGLDQAQGTPDFKKSLNKAMGQLRLSKTLIRNAFDEQYGDVAGTAAPADPLGIR